MAQINTEKQFMNQPNQQMREVLKQFAQFHAPSIETLEPRNARCLPTLKNAVEEMVAESFLARAITVAKPMPEPVGNIEHILIPTADGQLVARVFTPKALSRPYPVLVYFHGGGWVIANLDVYEASCRALCNATPCIVVSVAYRQAPEHKFPAAVEDAHAAVQWIMENARDFGGDPNRVAVGGESAGGNLATVACLKARDTGAKMPVGQLLIYPVTDARGGTESYEENAYAKPLGRSMMPWFFNHYLESPDQALDPYVSPILSEDLSGLPPAIVLTADIDPLRDEGEAYAKRLESFHVPVIQKRYDGVTHEFFGLAGVVDTATVAVEEAGELLRTIFRQAPVPAEEENPLVTLTADPV